MESERFFEIMGKYSTIFEKLLMIDERVAIQAFESKEMSTIRWITSKDNAADGTKKQKR